MEYADPYIRIIKNHDGANFARKPLRESTLAQPEIQLLARGAFELPRLPGIAFL
jgi:hypothetical protein